MAELGGDATAYWMCGGALGDLLAKLLDDAGVAHRPIPIGAMTRENFIAYERSGGQQYRFGLPGAKVSSDEVESCRSLLRRIDPPPQYLVLSGSLPLGVDDDLYARIASAIPRPCRVVLDTSGPALKRGVDTPVHLIKPNMRELGHLAGRTVEDDSQIREVARSLIRDGRTEAVVTSLGSGGAVLTTAEDHEHIRAPTVKIVSKVGAGDSMVGGIVLALTRGLSPADAVRYGVAAGSAAVMNEGTRLCRREDAERLYRSMVETR